MKFTDLFKLSTRMFKARTSRTLLTILGIGVGMGTILFLLSLGFGIQRAVLNKITTFDSLASVDVNSNDKTGRKINEETVQQLGYIKEIEKIIPLAKYQGQLEIKDYSTTTSFFLSGPGYVLMDGKSILEGEDLSLAQKNGVLLSSAFLKVLNKKEDELIGENLEVVLHIPGEEEGDFDEKAVSSDLVIVGIVEDEKSAVYLNLDLVSGLEIEEFSLIKIKGKNANQIDEIKEKINALGYKTSSVSEIVDQTKKFFGVISFVLVILGVVALFVSSIGMFNTMVISLLERTEEIGIMKAIGATDKNILTIFVVESALIGILGGISGVLLGFLTQIVFNLTVNFIAVRMGGEALSLFYTPLWFVFSLLAASLFIGIVTGWIPARKASIVDPLDALRNK